MLFELGQLIRDFEPPRFGADEDMFARANGRIVDERTHSDMNEGAITNSSAKA